MDGEPIEFNKKEKRQIIISGLILYLSILLTIYVQFYQGLSVFLLISLFFLTYMLKYMNKLFFIFYLPFCISLIFLNLQYPDSRLTLINFIVVIGLLVLERVIILVS